MNSSAAGRDRHSPAAFLPFGLCGALSHLLYRHGGFDCQVPISFFAFIGSAPPRR
jgi:hypothetical protein